MINDILFFMLLKNCNVKHEGDWKNVVIIHYYKNKNKNKKQKKMKIGKKQYYCMGWDEASRVGGF